MRRGDSIEPRPSATRATPGAHRRSSSPDTELLVHRQLFVERGEREDDLHELSDEVDDIEVDRYLQPSPATSQGDKPTLTELESSTLQSSSSMAFRLLKYLIFLAGVSWVLLAVFALLVEDVLPVLQRSLIPAKPIPLPYIAWSVSSNSVRSRDVLRELGDFRKPLELYEAEYVSLVSVGKALTIANSINSILILSGAILESKPSSQLAGKLQYLASLLPASREATHSLKIVAGQGFEKILRDVSRSFLVHRN